MPVSTLVLEPEPVISPPPPLPPSDNRQNVTQCCRFVFHTGTVYLSVGRLSGEKALRQEVERLTRLATDREEANTKLKYSTVYSIPTYLYPRDLLSNNT